MILGILQARVSSSRLPGKVLKPLLGVPMLLRQLDRLRKVRKISRLLVATSIDSSDNLIEDLCEEQGISYFRGSLNDVLDRFYQVGRAYSPEHIVRLTADCPLADPSLIDDVINFYVDGNFDYVSNCGQATFPDGLDVEVFRFSCLELAWQEATLPSQREHVTPFIYQQPSRFNLGDYKSPINLSHLRWTVDEPKDFELVTKIYESLYPINPDFATQDILNFLKMNPELINYNTLYQRNEGLKKSLLADDQLLNKKESLGMGQSQKNIFMEGGEGDRYFKRNFDKYSKDTLQEIPEHLLFISKYIKKEHKVLEIGCSTGINLERLRILTGCKGFGIDPSRDAIDQGKAFFPELLLEIGAADHLSFSSGYFDFVLFGFCLYVVDRSLLPKIVSEADRVVKDKAFLAITDFDSTVPTKRAYQHVPGIFSYKMDYFRLFTAYPHYNLAGKISYSHASSDYADDPNERVATTVLYKDHNSAYFLQRD